jgi:hypothetical protein
MISLLFQQKKSLSYLENGVGSGLKYDGNRVVDSVDSLLEPNFRDCGSNLVMFTEAESDPHPRYRFQSNLKVNPFDHNLAENDSISNMRSTCQSKSNTNVLAFNEDDDDCDAMNTFGVTSPSNYDNMEDESDGSCRSANNMPPNCSLSMIQKISKSSSFSSVMSDSYSDVRGIENSSNYKFVSSSSVRYQ